MTFRFSFSHFMNISLNLHLDNLFLFFFFFFFFPSQRKSCSFLCWLYVKENPMCWRVISIDPNLLPVLLWRRFSQLGSCWCWWWWLLWSYYLALKVIPINSWDFILAANFYYFLLWQKINGKNTVLFFWGGLINYFLNDKSFLNIAFN